MKLVRNDFIWTLRAIAESLGSLDGDVGRYFRGLANGINASFHSQNRDLERPKKLPRDEVIEGMLRSGLASYVLDEKRKKNTSQKVMNIHPEEFKIMMDEAEKFAELIMKKERRK